MSARTIQHPGIEIREIDMTNYTDIVTTNNAYVMGFTDRGPIYDYSWITTRSEFINLYGEPQTEAEKYLYYAVQSILNNGGTPIVSRMPYDNKQCKAYKALKIKYASVMKDENADEGITILDWDNDQAFNERAETLIDLEKQVGQYINPDGFPTVLETLQSQTVTRRMYASTGGAYTDTTLASSSLGKLTYRDLLFNLNKYIAEREELNNNAKNNTGDTDANLYMDALDAIYRIANINAYVIVDAHPDRKLSTVMKLNAYTKLDADLKSINSALDTVDGTKYRAQFGEAFKFGDSSQLTLTEYLKTFKQDLELSNKKSAVEEVKTVMKTFSDLSDRLKDFKEYIIEINKTEGLDLEYLNIAGAELDLFEIFVNAESQSHDKTVSGALNVLTENSMTKDLFKTISGFNAGEYADISDEAMSYDTLPEIFATYFSGFVSGTIDIIVSGLVNNVGKEIKFSEVIDTNDTTFTWNEKDNDVNQLLSDVINNIDDKKYINKFKTEFKLSDFSDSDPQIAIVSVTPNAVKVVDKNPLMSEKVVVPAEVLTAWTDNEGLSGWFNAYFYDKEVSGYVAPIKNWITVFKQEINDTKIEAEEFYKVLLINGKSPEDLAIPSSVIDSYITGLLSGTILDENGELLPIANITVATNPELITLDKALAKIYNDPYLKAFDGSLKGQAIIDAHLLTTPEINYTYGVYLDSRECDISNEQYDDLVVGSNFTKADMTVSRYGEDIDNANFIIVDKQKTIADGIGCNEGYFVTLIDPYDALKMQRLMTNPKGELTFETNVSNKTKQKISYWAQSCEYNWKTLFKTEINKLDTLQRVKNADGIWCGEVNDVPGKEQLLDSWSVPLTAPYAEDSISKSLMGMFPQIPLTDVAAGASSDNPMCTIDKQYSSHIVVAVCKTAVNPSDGKITVIVVEQFFGSLFEEKNVQNGRDLYIGNIINANSNYIEFYRNNYVKPAFGGGMDPAPYNRTAVPQFFIKDSAQLNNACKMVGIDPDIYDIDNVFFVENENGMFEYNGVKYDRKSNCPALIIKTYAEYLDDLKKSNIFVFNKKNTIIYNHHPEAVFTSFSKKESQKIIANTTGLFGQAAGTTANIGDNFIIDMDRCINFIKNVDDIPIYFVADAGLSTIAQFCDNVVWDDEARKWVTQAFDPDNDPDGDDRYITSYEDVATWRKVIDKLDQISREIRRDCMTIIDAPRQLTLDGAAPKIRKSRPQNNWDDMVGEKLRYISGINSSYTAGYYNWLRTTDEFSGKSFWLPPTCKIIGNYMYLNIVNLPWLAPAGLSYGIIGGIHAISHNPDPNEEDQIYLKSWNYVKQYPFDGFVIEGQKTTLTKNSAFNRVNVRTLFLDLERFVYNVARSFKYTVNNAFTREQFVNTIKPKFEDYMIRGGVYDYLIKCDDSNNTPETIDANELRCAIYIKPARLVEFIMIDFIAAKTGANFDEIVL